MSEPSPWRRPLAEILAIQPAGDDTFIAEMRGFGGVTLGCATLAAGLTCAGRALHSLHSYFLRPVEPGTTVELAVERVRDGRRFAHRRVQVRAENRLLCELMASFTEPGSGAAFQESTFDAATPGPEGLPSEEEIARAEGWKLDEPGPLGGPFEWRWIGIPWRLDAASAPSRYQAWVRPRFPLPPTRAFGAAALALLSDYHSHFPVARKLGLSFEPFGYTSLDQLLWAHRDRVWDDWWLLSSESDVAHAGRAFVRRVLYATDGQLIASMAQEQLIPNPT